MTDPHADQPVLRLGPPPGEARAVMIMLHGRGASPRNILDLVPLFDRRALTYIAPGAANHTWYPFSFLTPREQNEPFLSSALRRVETLVAEVAGHGIPLERIILLGFSQGACLAGEFAYRHPARYGALVMLSGALIGPPGTTWDTHRSLDGTPVFLGCSDRDAHIPKERVDESAGVFSQMRADVTERIYPGMGHLVSDDEIGFVQTLIDRVLAAGANLPTV